MTSIFVTYFLVLTVVIAGFYLLGSLIFALGKIQIKGKCTSIFAKLVLSSSLFVLSVSLFYTYGFTVNIFFIPILMAFAFKYWRKAEGKLEIEILEKNEIFRTGFVLFLVTLAYYIVRFCQVYNSDSDIPLTPHPDIVYYINCIDFLTHFGKENSSVDYVYGAELGTSPYHYFELWLGAGISKLFSLNTSLSVVLVTQSLGLFIIYIGCCAVLEHFKKIVFKDFIFCFFLVFVTGIAFDIYLEVSFMKYIYVYTTNAVTSLKFYPVYICVLSALLLFLKSYHFEALLVLICLPIINIGMAVSIFPSIIILQVLQWLSTKKYDLRITILIFSIAIGLLLFYQLGPKTNSHVSTNFLDTLNEIGTLGYLKTVFNIVVGSTLQYILIFSPFLLLLFPIGFKKDIIYRVEIQLVVLIYIFSVFSWAFLHNKLTTTQLFATISAVIFNILGIFLIIYLYKSKQLKIMSMILIGLFLIIGIKNSSRNYRVEYMHSKKYVESINNLSDKLSLCGSYVRSTEDYEYSFSYISNFAILGHYLIYAKTKTFPLSLSPHNFQLSSDPKLSKIEDECLKNTPFWIYVDKQKAAHKFESIEKSQVQFIEEMKINYLICTKNVKLSDSLKKKVKKQIVDENTGERFYILNI